MKRFFAGERPLVMAALVVILAFAVLAIALGYRVQDQNKINNLVRANRARLAETSHLARSTHAALCIFRHDLEQRYQETRAYLAKHPGPEPFPGVTRTSILLSLSNQRTTLSSLDSLKCQP